jgi:hypothetical protein
VNGSPTIMANQRPEASTPAVNRSQDTWSHPTQTRSHAGGFGLGEAVHPQTENLCGDVNALSLFPQPSFHLTSATSTPDTASMRFNGWLATTVIALFSLHASAQTGTGRFTQALSPDLPVINGGPGETIGTHVWSISRNGSGSLAVSRSIPSGNSESLIVKDGVARIVVTTSTPFQNRNDVVTSGYPIQPSGITKNESSFTLRGLSNAMTGAWAGVGMISTSATGLHLLIRSEENVPELENRFRFGGASNSGFFSTQSGRWVQPMELISNQGSGKVRSIWTGTATSRSVAIYQGGPLPVPNSGLMVQSLAVAASVTYHAGAVNDIGDVASIAIVTGPGITSANNQVIVAGPVGNMRILAQTGQPITNRPGSTSRLFGSSSSNYPMVLSMNSAGSTLQTATIRDLSTSTDRSSILLASQSGTHVIAAVGDPVPGANPGVVFSGTSSTAFPEYVLHPDSSVTFVGRYNVPTLGTYSGLFRFRDGQVKQMHGLTDVSSLFAESYGSTSRFTAIATMAGLGSQRIISDGIEVIPIIAPGSDSIPQSSFLGSGEDRGTIHIDQFGQVLRTSWPVNTLSHSIWTPNLTYRPLGNAGVWDDPTNWTLSIQPDHVHDVSIARAVDSALLGPAQNTTLRSLRIGGTSALNSLELRPAVTLTTHDGIRVATNGRLAGSGVVDGNLTLEGGAIVSTLGDEGSSSRIDITGNATLAGTLIVRLSSSEPVLPGTTFDLLTFASAADPSLDVINDTGFAGLLLNLNVLPDRATLAVSATPGDATLDGTVDFADLLKLAQFFDQPGNWLAGDFTADGRVNFSDLLLLAQNYAGSDFDQDWILARASVPEPTLPWLGITMSAVALRRRGRATAVAPR